MGWQDRPYSRDQSFKSNPLLWLFSGSVPLFTAFGVRVRMHASLLLLIVLALATSEMPGGMGIDNAMTMVIALFSIILLHEYGHCFAARSVGGDANEILMWPLGGLAFADAPQRPWPQFFTAAGGPLVNVAIFIICWVLEWIIFRHPALLLSPLARHGSGTMAVRLMTTLVWVADLNLGLLFFNLLPIFPLDGGRLLQGLLWFKLKYYRATMVTCVVGMVGSVLMAMVGIARFGSWYGLTLIFIGGSCFLYCFQLRAQLKAAGPWEFQDEGTDYSASMWPADEHPKKRRKLSRRKVRKLRKQAADEEAEQLRIDEILAKVSAHGMHSLTWVERRVLRRATERQRQREMELSRDRD
jgi:stage IV sporulation protein FB